ncbi:MAG: hypothetical protein HY392_05195 [Candidatus Diapherotrites archaeon]|nr:hypothetical protein [Candidatus Diapherotrites archaeon]
MSDSAEISSKAIETIETLEKLKENTVVLLGSYKEKHREFLDNVATVLQIKFRYTPLILDNVYTVNKGTPRQVIHNLLSGCNFVIADDTVPSGESLELEYSRNVGALTAIICRFHEKGWPRSTFMTADFDVHSLDFKTFRFNSKIDNLSQIEKLIVEITKWKDGRKKDITKRMQEREKSYNLYQEILKNLKLK